MMKTVITATRITALTLAFGLSTGCATSSSLEEVKGIADNALREAQAASQKADSAMSEIGNSSATAMQAQQAADNALACCQDNTDRLDRMFQKAMMK